MIDIFTESLVTLNQARAYPVFHTNGRRASIHKLYRLTLQGTKDANGNRVQLETVRTPTGLMTSREAVERFIQRLTNPDNHVPNPTPRVRQDQITKAEQELIDAGFEVGAPA